MRSHEFEASFMYAAGHGSAMTISRWTLHADAPETQVVVAWCPCASPGHSKAKPGAAYALRYSSAALQPDSVASPAVGGPAVGATKPSGGGPTAEATGWAAGTTTSARRADADAEAER